MPAADRGRVVVQRQSAARTAALDLALTRLALRNLLANALAFSAAMPATARGAAAQAARPVILHLADSEDPLGLTIDVIDQGTGIDPKVLPRLFERGVHGQRSGDHASHGLGLYIARRALELQGGSVHLLRTGPEGTAMRLLLSQSDD
jgi:two-component system, OmpR family, sensor kinase